MSQKINTTSIGLFIVSGLALGVAGLLLFSSAKLFTNTREVIVYFDESLNGLNEGAPVKYRGVTIGSVKRVMVRYNQATNDYAMPVILEIQEQLVRRRLGEAMEVLSDSALEDRIKHGLRASLQSESLVTGVLYVDIRPNPNAPPPVFHQVQKIYAELPTEPTQIQKLFSNLASLDIKSIETNLNAALLRFDAAIGAMHTAEINRGITNLLASMDRLVSNPDISNDLAGLRITLDEYRSFGEKLNRRLDPLADSFTNSLAEANRAMAQIRGAAENLRTLVAPESTLRIELDQTLQQLAAAAESIATLADFLKQHPNALITGRKAQEKKP